MDEDPRFVCRREGHDPMFEVKSDPARVMITAYTTCKRCGKWLVITEQEDGVFRWAEA